MDDERNAGSHRFHHGTTTSLREQINVNVNVMLQQRTRQVSNKWNIDEPALRNSGLIQLGSDILQHLL